MVIPLFVSGYISISWVLLIGFIWLALTMVGSALIGLNYHFDSLNSNSKISTNKIAITFDDGPNPDFTNDVLAILKKHDAKATFFCIGKHIETHPELLKNIINNGHTIGNHTYSHANIFGFYKTAKVIQELNRTNEIVKRVAGLNLKLFRPAFGVTNPRIKTAINQLNLTSIGWNKRSFDTTSLDENKIFNRITKNIKKGDIILLHDSSEKTLKVLERLLLFLQEKNLQSVTVNELLNVKPYA